CGRLLADLGADVILIEPPGGLPHRQQPPLHQGVSLQFATHNANKRSLVLDLSTPEGRDQFGRLLDSSQLLLDTLAPGVLERLGLAPTALRASRPGLIVLSASDYGQTGPWRDQVATHSVHAATAGFLCRSGLPGQQPLLPPGDLVWETAALQAAWVAMLGLWQQAKTG
ncbi:MAG: CoA transferase, partial [Pseudomonas sp. PGPPP3]